MAGLDFFQSLSLFRSRSNVKLKVRGNSVRHHTVSNPYHAVSIHSPFKGCVAAQELAGKRFLATEAPQLPLAACTAATCTCRYAHHNDRRAGPRRSYDSLRTQNQFFRGEERRRIGGRRITDH
jgi:hypothetical protein